ncbi:MAG: ATP-dependent Clp protease proteolytic subunit [Janthinobacterium lividum]
MPELTIHVPSYIGASYMDWDTCEWVQGITWPDIEMQLAWAEMMGEKADAILLSIGACDGGSTLEGFNIYNKLRALGLPIRTHITGYAASMAVPVALAADAAPEMDYLAQLMLHSASYNGGTGAETSAAMRAQADRLDNTNQLLFDLLTARSGQPADVVNGWLSPLKDTWLTATQAHGLGLCGKVNPLAAATTAVEADSLITARRARTANAVARADKRAAITATVKNAVPAAPIVMPDVKKPIGAAVKPVPRAAAKPAAKAPQARKTLFTKLMEALGIEEDGAETDEAEAVATVESTELDNGAFLYHDGALAQGALVFNDEALTEATGDGDYDTADAQVVSVAAGAVTAIAAAEAAATEPAPATATALAKRLDRLEANLGTITKERDTLATENAALKKLKPALPQARAARPNADAPDAKAPKAKLVANPDAGTL